MHGGRWCNVYELHQFIDESTGCRSALPSRHEIEEIRHRVPRHESARAAALHVAAYFDEALGKR